MEWISAIRKSVEYIEEHLNALQSINTRIFKEWLPGNPNYEISGNANVEWYDCMNGEKTDPDYHSAVWLPVKRK